MSDESLGIGRALSAVLQSVHAQACTGDGDTASTAFLHEYEADLAVAVAAGPEATVEFWRRAFCAMSGASIELVRYVVEQTGGDPREWLPPLVRAQRQAEREDDHG